MNELPNELLISIFEYLTTSDRLKIVTVCESWFALLQKPIFIKDNHIYLNECIINKKFPPYKTFCNGKQSHRNFTHLTLNKIKFDFNNLTDIKIFFKKIGKDVVHLEIGLEFEIKRLPNLLKFFPNLKSLELKDAMQLNILEGPYAESLDTLTISGLSHNFEFSYIDKIPNLKVVKRDYVNFYMLNNQVPKRFIKADERLISILSALDVHAVVKTELNYLGSQEITADHITHVTCSGSKEKLQGIGRDFLNLKSLSFDFVRNVDETDQCFFGHESILGFESVQNLIFNERSTFLSHEMCDECFETFLISFKNIKNLKMHAAFNKKMINSILTKLKNLRDLSVFSHNKESLYEFELSSIPILEKLQLWSENNASITNDIFRNWPSMSNLQELEISLPFKGIEPTSWIRFCSQCPSLMKFHHNCQKYCINDTLLVLTTKLWPKLRHLSIASAHKLTQISFKSLKSNCPLLKTLQLGRNWLDMGLVYSLFNNLKQLQHLEWTDARDYYQKVHTRVDFYESRDMIKKKPGCSIESGKEKRQSDTSDSSDDDEDDDDKKVWGWIPVLGWGFWSKTQLKNVHRELEPEFIAKF
uniref:CSON015373 protein n=1 Tax=Culicoides sonorensis TaxID=179676 RepID=A0A336K668_CULSO